MNDIDYRKRREEEITRATQLWECGDITRENLEYIFPELKESENEWIEKIKKDMISYLNNRQIKSIAESSATETWIAWLEKRNSVKFNDENDGRIRKAISQCVEDMRGQFEKLYNVHHKDAIAWLEKQGQSKPTIPYKAIRGGIAHFGITQYQIDNWLKKYVDVEGEGQSTFEQCKQEGDRIVENPDGTHFNLSQLERAAKVEPKFHKDDWITDGQLTCKVLSVMSKAYELHLYNDDYCHFRADVRSVDKHYHLWTIQEAKDGDVLAGSYGTFIFMSKSDGYCGVLSNNTFIRSTGNNEWTEGLHPATKEQHDALMKAMIAFGYEWNAEKKELKGIEQQPSQWNISDYRTWQYIVSDVLTKHDGIGQYLDDGFCKKIAKYMQENWSKKLSLGQISAWTEEDERIYQSIIDDTVQENQLDNKQINWIESFKDRVRPKQEWTEEDERAIGIIKIALTHPYNMDGKYDREFAYDWLKSLKQRMKE